MDAERHDLDSRSLTVAADRPLMGVLSDEDGRRIVRYFVDDGPTTDPAESEATLRAALAVVGAWSDLDWDEFADELDRIRHESRPTPPIEL